MNFSYIRKLIKISIGATEGLVQQQLLCKAPPVNITLINIYVYLK